MSILPYYWLTYSGLKRIHLFGVLEVGKELFISLLWNSLTTINTSKNSIQKLNPTLTHLILFFIIITLHFSSWNHMILPSKSCYFSQNICFIISSEKRKGQWDVCITQRKKKFVVKKKQFIWWRRFRCEKTVWALVWYSVKKF